MALHWQTRREGALLPLKGARGRGTPVTTRGRAVLPRHDGMLGLGWSGEFGGWRSWLGYWDRQLTAY